MANTAAKKIVELADQHGVSSDRESLVAFALGYADGLRGGGSGGGGAAPKASSASVVDATHRPSSSQQRLASRPVLAGKATTLAGKTVALIGAGSVGFPLAAGLVRNTAANVTFGARSVPKTEAEVAEKTAAIGLAPIAVATIADAIAAADVVIVAISGAHDDAGIQAIATSLGNVAGKVVIDCTNPVRISPFDLSVRWGGDGTSAAEVLQAALPGAAVYKAFNTIGAEHMQDPSGRFSHSRGTDMLFAGSSDAAALALATDVVRGTGFTPIHVGPLRYARNLEALAELWIHMAAGFGMPARSLPRSIAFALHGLPTPGGDGDVRAPDKVIVLGSSGNVGVASVKALLAKPFLKGKVVAGVRNANPADPKNAGLEGAELVAADMGKPETLAAAIPAGASVLVVTPGHEDRTALALSGVRAAVQAGAGHIVLISGTSSSGIFASQFRPVENELAASGTPFTIVRLPLFIDNLFGQPIKAGGAIYLPVDGDIKGSQVAVRDIGEVVANVIARPSRFSRRTLNISGVLASGNEAAAAFTKALGKPVVFTQVPPEVTRESFLGAGYPSWQVEGILELYALQGQHDTSVICPDGDNDTEEALGRPATTLEQFAEAVKGFFQ